MQILKSNLQFNSILLQPSHLCIHLLLKKLKKNADTALFFAQYNFYTHIYLMRNLLGFNPKF